MFHFLCPRPIGGLWLVKVKFPINSLILSVLLPCRLWNIFPFSFDEFKLGELANQCQDNVAHVMNLFCSTDWFAQLKNSDSSFLICQLNYVFLCISHRVNEWSIANLFETSDDKITFVPKLYLLSEWAHNPYRSGSYSELEWKEWTSLTVWCFLEFFSVQFISYNETTAGRVGGWAFIILVLAWLNPWKA